MKPYQRESMVPSQQQRLGPGQQNYGGQHQPGQQQQHHQHGSTPLRYSSPSTANVQQLNTSSATTTTTSMLPMSSTSGVFPSKPLGSTNPRPSSGVYPTSGSPRMTGSGQVSGFPVPAPRSMPSNSGSSMTNKEIRAGQMNQQQQQHYQHYYPSLSGSETDVSTSTENLTQEERFLLRHMERQDPQGEENGEGGPISPLMSHHLHQLQHSMTSSSDPFANNPTLQMQLHHYQQQHMMRPSLFLSSGSAGGHARMATPTAGPMMMTPKSGMIDFPSFPNAMMPRSLHDEFWATTTSAANPRLMRPASPIVTGGLENDTLAAAAAAISSASANLSKLNPSVYSYPNAQDPVLMMPKSYLQHHHHGHQDLAMLAGRRANVEMTSSGAFFDPRGVSRMSAKDSSQTEILAQLAREMRLQQQAGGGIFSYSSDAVSTSSGGSGTNLNQILAPNTTATSASSSNTSPAKSVVTTASSGYKTGGDSDVGLSGSSTGEGRQLQVTSKATSASSLATMEGGTASTTGSGSTLSNSPQSNSDVVEKSPSNPVGSVNVTVTHDPSLSQPEDSPQSDIETVVTYTINNNKNAINNNNAKAAAAILETLKNENQDMKMEILELRKKVSKVSLLEEEMAKVHQAYQSLLKHSEKREQLEKAARAKLQSVILNLSEANKEVSERHEAVMSQLMSGDMKNQNIPGLDAILRGEILRKDALIRQLLEQNKMLLMAKERQEVEMTAQGETLEEQRAHIQILDTALSNAQAAIVRLEEENRVKEGYAERVQQMTKSLEQLQAASEKRESMEKKLRAKLEEELKELRAAAKGDHRNYQNPGTESAEELRQKFREAEERIIRLEAERTQWEQRYLEESAMRQVAIDAASIPKDAKIAALEKNSAETEKMIAEARSDKMKQFEELQNSQRKIADLETLVKTFETTLSERDATIRILKSHKMLSSTSNIEDFFAAINAPAASKAMSMNVSDGTNVISIPIQQQIQQQQQQLQQQQHQLQQQQLQQQIQQQQHQQQFLPASLRAIHNKSLSHLMSPSVLSASSSAAASPMTSSLYSGGIGSSAGIGGIPSFCISSSPYVVTPSVAPSIYDCRSTMSPYGGMSASGLSAAAALNYHHGRQLSTPSITSNPGSRLAPSYLSAKGRSLTPSADMMLHMRSTTPNHLAALEQLKSGRRDSAPGSVYSTSLTNIRGGPTLINTSDLYTNVGSTITGGGTMPKMSMAVFKDANRSGLSKQYGSGYDCFLDDTIGSFMGSVTPTRIDGSPSHAARHDGSKTYEGSKNYIEGIWRI